MKIIDYHCTLGVPYQPHDILYPRSARPQTKGHAGCWSAVPIGECLTGTKWDALALAFVSAFKPTSIRVTAGETKSNYSVGRVTVYVDKDDIIQSIEMECMLAISNTLEVHNGHELMQAIEKKVANKC